MFTAIKINDTNYKFKTGGVENEINGLNKINIFVGQNNSGKSRFMREIFSEKNEFKDDINISLSLWNEFIEKLDSLLLKNISHNDHIFIQISSLIRGKKMDYLKLYTEINTMKSIYDSILKNVNSLITGGVLQHHRVVFKDVFDKDIKPIISEDFFDVENPDFNRKIYIPMLRGLRNPIKDSKEDFYSIRTFQDYFESIGSNITTEVFTGLSLYEDIKKMLLGNHEQRENVKQFEKFLEDNFFQGQLTTLVPNYEKDVLCIDIGENKNKPIYNLGDGIQSIIINTFPFFKYKDENIMLFIEEPEMGIHPGMQRILLNIFANGIKGQKGIHQIYFTTHSNHFLDIALEKDVNNKISIYQFNETENQDKKEIKNISQNKEILDLLGVKTSSVFLSNCIIWVEGISDRIYIKKFLELYQEKQRKVDKNFKIFEEDKHFSIIEYAGGNITHFNFGEYNDEDKISVDAINKNNFILADNDLETSGKKFDRLNELKVLVGEDNIYFDYPEIENLTTYEVYQKYFESNEGKNWQKKQSRCWTKSTYEKNIFTMNIGVILKNTFIELIPGKVSEKFSKGTDISIIGKKDEIAERVISFIYSYDEMSTKAKEITEKLYKFIEGNNK